MNLWSINVGQIVGAQGDSSQGSNGASTNTSKDMVKVLSGDVSRLERYHTNILLARLTKVRH